MGGLEAEGPARGRETVETFTIITTEAQGRVRELHTRMPVTIAPADFDAWLAPATPKDELRAILARASAKGLVAYAVSPRVNSVRNEDAELVQSVTVPAAME